MLHEDVKIKYIKVNGIYENKILICFDDSLLKNPRIFLVIELNNRF